MKINKIVALSAVAAALLTVPAETAAAAPADSACTFAVGLPSMIGFSTNVQSVPVALSANCPAAASYHLRVSIAGTDNFNDGASFGPLLYDQATKTASFQFASCAGQAEPKIGHFSAALLSADARDSQGDPVTPVQLQPSSTVVADSALAYSASSRKGNAVYLNGLAKTYGFGFDGHPPMEYCGFARYATTMYLQRLLNGSWQTMLARDTAPDGTATVGFVQSKVYQYRWVVLGEAAAPAGTTSLPTGLLGSASASTVR